jgi:hypothetical protein
VTVVPYPADTRAKGWRFELDHERIRQSDTWALATPELRPWLLMLWMVAWEQTPCGSLPNDGALIAARIGMRVKAFAQCRDVLLRGWYEADDGRLYHETMTERVRAMLAKRVKDAQRAADHRAKTGDSRKTNNGITRDSRVTNNGVMPQSDPSSTPSTKHQKPESSEPNGSGASAPPDTADTIFALGVPLLTAANVADRNARSMLGLMRKTHGDPAVIEALQRCATEKPIQPVAWLQAALKTAVKPTNRQIAIEDENRRVAQAWVGSVQ